MKNKIKFEFWNTNKVSEFKSWTLIPTIVYVVDKQMLPRFFYDGEEQGGVIEYSLILYFWNFQFSIIIEKYTK